MWIRWAKMIWWGVTGDGQSHASRSFVSSLANLVVPRTLCGAIDEVGSNHNVEEAKWKGSNFWTKWFIHNAQSLSDLLHRVLAYRHQPQRPRPRQLPRLRHHGRRRAQDGPALDRHRDGRARRHALPAPAGEGDRRRAGRHQRGGELARRRRLSLPAPGRADLRRRRLHPPRRALRHAGRLRLAAGNRAWRDRRQSRHRLRHQHRHRPPAPALAAYLGTHYPIDSSSKTIRRWERANFA
jgi:hypothetical protein